jgi:hypothetical protein
MIVAVGHGEANSQRVTQRPRHREAAPFFLIVRNERTRLPGPLASRRGSHNVENAGDGALAEQGALRAAQYFHAVNIDQVGERLSLKTERHVVYDNGYIGLNGDAVGESTDTAYGNAEIGGLRVVVDCQPR